MVMQLDKVSNSDFRLKRFSHFLDIVSHVPPLDRPLRILDIGGEEAYWSDKIDLIGRPVKITLINLWSARAARPQFEVLIGDARSLPDFHDDSFDIVHSNSVIEHVGQ